MRLRNGGRAYLDVEMVVYGLGKEIQERLVAWASENAQRTLPFYVEGKHAIWSRFSKNVNGPPCCYRSSGMIECNSQ